MAVKSLIETVTVGAGGAASIEFTAIPQEAGSDLILVISSRLDGAQYEGKIQFNSDTASNYSSLYLYGNGAGEYSGLSTGVSLIFQGMGRSSATANTFASDTIYVSNYTSAVAKSISIDAVSENNDAADYSYILSIGSGKWSGTAAITSLRIFSTENFVQYSTASLYKIKYD